MRRYPEGNATDEVYVPAEFVAAEEMEKLLRTEHRFIAQWFPSKKYSLA